MVSSPATTWAALEPRCPVCRVIGVGPNLPLVVGEVDGSFDGAVLAGVRLFVCQACGVLFVGFVDGG